MYANLHIVCLLAAAAARHVPENYDPLLIPPPLDFPRLSLAQHTLQSSGTGINGRNGEVVHKIPRYIDDYVDGNDHRSHNRRPVHLEPQTFFDKHRSGNDRPQNIRISQENCKEIDTYLPKSDRNLDQIQDDEKTKHVTPSHHDRNVDVNLGNENKNKQHNNVQKQNGDVTEKREQQNVRIAPTNPIYTSRDNLGNNFNGKPAKTNLNSSSSQNSKNNQVTSVPFEESTIEGGFKVNVNEDKWLWNSTTTIIPTGPDVDDRSAFDGGECPTGKVRVKGSTKCVDKDED